MNKTLEQIKTEAIVKSLLENGLNQSKAAKQLDISRGALRAYLISYAGAADNDDKLNQRVLRKYFEYRGSSADSYDWLLPA